jgi:hypothetical protein
VEIMRRSGLSKPVVWRWQERFMREGVDGLLRDKTRPPGKAPLDAKIVKRIVDLTLADPPGETTHWTGRAMADAAGVSLRSVQRVWMAVASEIRFERTDDGARQGSGAQQRLRTARSGVCRARPSQAKHVFASHYNKRYISQGFGEGVPR